MQDLKAAVLSVVLIVSCVLGAVALDAAGLTWYAPWRANKVTEITRNTNQYVTTQQELIADGERRYADPDATEAQKKSAVQDMCRAANRIDRQYVPVTALVPMQNEGCYR